MTNEQDAQTKEALIATLEREHEGSVIKLDEHGYPVGIEEQTPREEALSMGVLFTLFGGVFFFIPLWMLMMFLENAYLSEMFCIVPFFGIFLFVGGAMLDGGLKTLFSGITGKGLTYVVSLEELAERKDEEDDLAPTAFSYASREELLDQIHQTKTTESAQAITSTEDKHQPAGAFWSEINDQEEHR